MRRAGIAFAAALVVAGVVLLREAAQLPTGWTPSGPGPGFFPFWLGAGFTLSAAVVLARAWNSNHDRDQPFLTGSAGQRILVVFLPMVAVVALLRYLGIYLGGALYLVCYTRFVGRHPWLLSLAVGVGVPAVLFFVFERWFLMPMPKGTILEWFLYGR